MEVRRLDTVAELPEWAREHIASLRRESAKFRNERNEAQRANTELTKLLNRVMEG